MGRMETDSVIDEIMQRPAVLDFLETWGPNCGASREVFAGHVRAMLHKLASSGEPSLLDLFARSRERQAGNIKVDPIQFLRRLRDEED